MRRFLFLRGLLGLLAVTGCNQILGIEDHDLVEANTGGSAGQSRGGSAGSAVGGGMTGAGKGGQGGSSNGGASGTTLLAGADPGGADSAGGTAGTTHSGGGDAGGTGADGGTGNGGQAGSAGCSNECTLSATACAQGSLKTCEQGESGCTEWSAAVGCGTGKCADAKTCFECEDTCMTGDASCTANEISVCQSDTDGCFAMSTPTPCTSGFCGSATSCGDCDDKCSAGDVMCAGGMLSQCAADIDGCLDYATTACGSGFCANATTCGVCNNQCTLNETRCANGKLETCVADADGCLDWSTPATSCPSGFCANTTSCGTCNNKCNLGQFTCSGSTLVACAADGNNCRDYTGTQTPCSGDTPVCDASGGRCACSTAPSHCLNSTTALTCTNGSVTNVPCTGSTPTCVDGLACEPCSEHSQCPSSACRLSEYSANYGSCFPTNSVQNISSAGGLQTAIDALTSTSVAVYKLSATTFPVAARADGLSGTPIPKGAEIAIIGANGAKISGATTGVFSSSVSMLAISGIVYVSNVDINTPGCPMTALWVGGDFQQTPPPTLWLDDLALTQWATALSTASGDTHIRRSVIRSTADYSVKVEGGALYVQNSVLGPDASPPNSAALYTADGPYIDIRYSNLWGYDTALYCNDGVTGSTQGAIRNSILLDQDSTHSSIDPKCTALSFPGAAGTALGLAPAVSWFANVSNNDFHLTTTGANQLGKTATWATGDPAVDIDGTAHPKGTTGYAGIDER